MGSATGRKTDLITLDLQGDLATRLGYGPRGGLLASELLMRDYYRRAFKLHEICRSFVELHVGSPGRRFRFLPSLRLRRRTSRGFEVKDGALHARRREARRCMRRRMARGSRRRVPRSRIARRGGSCARRKIS